MSAIFLVAIIFGAAITVGRHWGVLLVLVLAGVMLAYYSGAHQ